MKRFSELRVRFAKTLCRMVDYGTGKEESPRPLKIASVLLMTSASDSLNELINDIYADAKLAAVQPLSEIKKTDIKYIPRYVRFLNSMGAISTSIVSFLQMTDRAEADEETTLLIEFIKSLRNALRNVMDIGNSVKLRQGNYLYSVFEHESLSKAAEDMLSNLENNKVIELLEEKGVKDVARNMKETKKDIENQIKNSEKLIRMKERQGVPGLDPSREVDLVITSVA